MSKSGFNPNNETFAGCIQRILSASSPYNLNRSSIITSLDEGIDQLLKDLETDNVPEGFTKYQLPVFLTDIPGVNFFYSTAVPFSRVSEHSHNEGDGFRLITSGSIIYENKELKAGDWMFIPKGSSYSFEVGTLGVGMFYCYACCCA